MIRDSGSRITERETVPYNEDERTNEQTNAPRTRGNTVRQRYYDFTKRHRQRLRGRYYSMYTRIEPISRKLLDYTLDDRRSFAFPRDDYDTLKKDRRICSIHDSEGVVSSFTGGVCRYTRRIGKRDWSRRDSICKPVIAILDDLFPFSNRFTVFFSSFFPVLFPLSG